jgi:hypothetical protein
VKFRNTFRRRTKHIKEIKNSLLFSKVSVPSRLFTVQCIHLAEVLILTDYLAEKEENDTYYVDSASSQCTNFSSTQIGFSNGGFGQRPPPPYLNSPSQLREYNLSRGRGFGARGSTWAGRFATSTHIHQQENRYFFCKLKDCHNFWRVIKSDNNHQGAGKLL